MKICRNCKNFAVFRVVFYPKFLCMRNYCKKNKKRTNPESSLNCFEYYFEPIDCEVEFPESESVEDWEW